MIQTIRLTPGVVLRHCPDSRFKKGALSIQLLRPMCPQECAHNALLSAVLLRGTAQSPDLRSITQRLDSLYGASVGTLVRRVGNIQTVGLYLSFLEDHFAPAGEPVLEPMLAFLEELLLRPRLEDGLLSAEFVESEKKNLIATIEAERNDKRAYAAAQLLRHMCRGDSFAVPRLGRVEDVEGITPQSLTAHYRYILTHSPVELLYVGAAEPERISRLLLPLARSLGQSPEKLPEQTAFVPAMEPAAFSETLEVAQSKLCMGFVCGITNQSPDFAAMQVFNTLFGGGMTSRLFVHVREKLSLCYYASSAYYPSKGIVTVSCGMDEGSCGPARDEILKQLEFCQKGEITDEELEGARKALLASLQATPDSPGALENFYSTAAIGGLGLDIAGYCRLLRQVTRQDVIRVAGTVRLHTEFLLKGVRP